MVLHFPPQLYIKLIDQLSLFCHQSSDLGMNLNTIDFLAFTITTLILITFFSRSRWWRRSMMRRSLVTTATTGGEYVKLSNT